MAMRLNKCPNSLRPTVVEQNQHKGTNKKKEKEGKRRDEVKLFNPISFLFLATILGYWHCFAAVVINWMPRKGYREQGKWVLRSSEGKNEFCMHYASPTLPLVVVLCKNMNNACQTLSCREPWNCFKEVNLVLNKCNLCLEHLFDKLTF